MQTRISENPMNTRKKIVATFITIGIALAACDDNPAQVQSTDGTAVSAGRAIAADAKPELGDFGVDLSQ